MPTPYLRPSKSVRRRRSVVSSYSVVSPAAGDDSTRGPSTGADDTATSKSLPDVSGNAVMETALNPVDLLMFLNDDSKAVCLRIRAARWRECVYVLQSVFVVVVFSVRHNEVHKYETTVLGNG